MIGWGSDLSSIQSSTQPSIQPSLATQQKGPGLATRAFGTNQDLGLRGGQGGDFGADLLGQGGREVALGRRAGDRDDALAGELRTLGELEGGPNVGAGRDTDRQAFA